jgi:hypothetical protein
MWRQVNWLTKGRALTLAGHFLNELDVFLAKKQNQALVGAAMDLAQTDRLLLGLEGRRKLVLQREPGARSEVIQRLVNDQRRQKRGAKRGNPGDRELDVGELAGEFREARQVWDVDTVANQVTDVIINAIPEHRRPLGRDVDTVLRFALAELKRAEQKSQTDLDGADPVLASSAAEERQEKPLSLSQLVDMATKITRQRNLTKKEKQEKDKKNEEEGRRVVDAFIVELEQLSTGVHAAMDLARRNLLDLYEHTGGEVPLIFTRHNGKISVEFAQVYQSYHEPSLPENYGYYVERFLPVDLTYAHLADGKLTIDRAKEGLKQTIINLLPPDMKPTEAQAR